MSSSEFGFTVVTAQKYQTDKKVWNNGSPVGFDSVSNSAKASDVSPATSSQEYRTFNSEGNFYDCQIASKENILTSVSQGCAPAGH